MNKREMKKSVLIIEDDLNQLHVLEQLVSSVDENAVVYTASDEKTAYKILMEKTIDVFLVDIILDTSKPGDTSGVRLVEKLRKVSRYLFTPVIFVTSLEDPTLYCFKDLNCIGYIEKPFAPEKIVTLVKRALNYTTEREKEVSVTFRRDGILYPVEVKNIVYMESMKHMMYVHMNNHSVLEVPYKTCNQILMETDTNCLIQCSRSTIINKDYVNSIDTVNRYVTFKDDLGCVDIGLTYKKKMVMEFGNGS